MKTMIKGKWFTGAIFMMLAAMLVLSACGNNSTNKGGSASPSPSPSTSNEVKPSEAAPTPETKLSGTVTLAGSTSVLPLAEELSLAFMDLNKDVRVEVAGGGSGAGVKAAQAGTADIGMASRAIKAEETGIEPVVIAIDGIAVVINASKSDVANLTIEQVKDIFTGKVKNWSEVGGADANIVVVNREEGSGTRDAFAEIVLGGEEFVADAIIQNSTGAVREAVNQDVNAIGYISTGGLNNTVQALSVNDNQPTDANIKAGSYPIARPFNFVINESGEPSEAAQAFIDYVLSADGQAIVADNGYVTTE